MKSWIAFAAVFLLFNALGGAFYVVATSAVSGILYWTAFLILGAAAGQKTYGCFSGDAGSRAS